MRFSLEVPDDAVDDPAGFARLVVDVLGVTLEVSTVVTHVVRSNRETNEQRPSR
jgi:hypothetical protein